MSPVCKVVSGFGQTLWLGTQLAESSAQASWQEGSIPHTNSVPIYSELFMGGMLISCTGAGGGGLDLHLGVLLALNSTAGSLKHVVKGPSLTRPVCPGCLESQVCSGHAFIEFLTSS